MGAAWFAGVVVFASAAGPKIRCRRVLKILRAHLCLDKGYDSPTGRRAVAAYGYQPHIRRIGAEELTPDGGKGFPTRR